jgi:hypothetical protein
VSIFGRRVGLGVGLGLGLPVVAGGAYTVVKKLRAPRQKQSGMLPMIIGNDSDGDDETAHKERSPQAAV